MVKLADIQAAAAGLEPYIHRTPVVTNASLDERLGCHIFLKCENLQKAGAFKSRGALHSVLSLSDSEAQRGVLTHSSGNHAGALARAARVRGIPAYIVMPRTAPPVKSAAVQGYGGQITYCEPNVAARESAARELQLSTGAAFIHPYDDDRIIAGQGTAALELLEQVPELDVVLAPIGGGGLIGGTLLAVKESQPRIQVWGAEPAVMNDAWQGWRAGVRQPPLPPQSLADGLLTSVGERNFPLLQKYADDILLASEEAILRMTWYLIQRTKLLIEPSSAVPLAALAELPRERLNGLRIGVIVSGGNVDFTRLPPPPVEPS